MRHGSCENVFLIRVIVELGGQIVIVVGVHNINVAQSSYVFVSFASFY